MWRYLDIKTITSALIVAALVSAIGIWGNSRLLDYKFLKLSEEIGILKTEKVDKAHVDRLNMEIVTLRSEKADRVLVESKWMELKAEMLDLRGDVKYLIRLHIDGKEKGK